MQHCSLFVLLLGLPTKCKKKKFGDQAVQQFDSNLPAHYASMAIIPSSVMKLNLKDAFAAILRLGKAPQYDNDDNLPVSMVLLRREPRFPTLDQLRLAAEGAFDVSFAETQKESRHFVIQTALLTIMKAGPHTLSFLNQAKPYGEGEFAEEFGRSLPKASQRRVWKEHKAWTAVDYVQGGVDLELEYGVLAKICAELLDLNCVGVYVPQGAKSNSQR